jgi:hypothetical protein
MRLVPDNNDICDDREKGKNNDDPEKRLTVSRTSQTPSNADEDGEDAQNRGHVDLFLPPRSLYALTGVGRYSYSHQLLPDSSVFTSPIGDGKAIVVKRDQRLSVIFRDAKRE